MKPSSLIKIFEKVVEPILLYNCEITQAFLPSKWSYIDFKDNIWKNENQINQVIRSFLRQILGVGKKTSTWVITTETGKYPIVLKVYIQIMKYWIRLLNIESKYMQESQIIHAKLWKSNKSSWCKIIEYLLKYTNLEKGFNIKDVIERPNSFLDKFRRNIFKNYLDYWKKEQSSISNTKLDFYKSIKKHFSFERYLDILKKEYRTPITRLRLSNHNFPIEILRYKKNKKDQNIGREDRKCQICDLDEIGNEIHYLAKCNNTKIVDLRNIFIRNLKYLQPQFEHFNDLNIIKYCINMNDEIILEPFSTFVKDVFEIYKEEEQERLDIFGK